MMAMTRAVWAFVCLAVACGGENGSPTAPSPPPAATPSPVAITLSGTVSSATGARLGGATVTFLDGPNTGRSTTANSNGEYAFATLNAGNSNLVARAGGYVDDGRGISLISGAHTLAFTLQPGALWTVSGTGNNVFDKPLHVTRVRITGAFSGHSSNFIVRCGGSLLVNELLGTGWGPTTYSGVHATPNCTQIQITNSTQVSWTFTEVR